MNPATTLPYRRLRNQIALALALIWMAWCWFDLNAKHAAAVVGLEHCNGFWHSIGCSMQRSNADGAFGAGMFGAILLAPLALIPARYAARWKIEHDERRTAKAEQEREAARLATQRQESDARLAAAERNAQHAHQTIERSDFIHKLGAVSDFLDLLVSETDPNRITNIRLGAAQALRELVARHTTAQLAALIRADDAIAISLTAILGRLSAASFDTAGEVRVLRTALGEVKELRAG